MTAAEADALCGQFIERGVMGVFFVSFEHQTDRETTNQRITERAENKLAFLWFCFDRDMREVLSKLFM